METHPNDTINHINERTTTTSTLPIVNSQRLVGLSPQFWAYTPLLIGDVHRLYLDPSLGLDCIVSKSSSTTTSPSSSSIHETLPLPHTRKVPISKCKLTGVIIAAARKSNHAAYVLDDGTGCIDCISWEETDEGDDPFASPLFPSFASSNPTQPWNHATKFVVGDIVQVYGRIKIVYIPPTMLFHDPSLIILSTTATDDSMMIPDAYSHVVREIDVNIMDYCDEVDRQYGYDPLLGPVSKTYTKGRGLHELSHWLQCLHFSRRMAVQVESHGNNHIKPLASMMDIKPIIDDSRADEQDDTYYSFLKRQLSIPVYTGGEIFTMLPIEERNKFVRRSSWSFKNDKKRSKSLPNTITDTITTTSTTMENLDKKYGARQLFGYSCPCNAANGVSYKYHLLYCHCTATVVDVDSNLTFRDALLVTLIDMETQYKNSQQRNLTSTFSEVESIQSTHHQDIILKFSYKDICNNHSLLKTAKQVIECSSSIAKSDPSVLIRRTFFALREDGIVYLMNTKLDEYILLSLESVLFPYIEMTSKPSSPSDNILERIHLQKKRPNYLVKVSSERLHVAKNMYRLHNITKRLEEVED